MVDKSKSIHCPSDETSGSLITWLGSFRISVLAPVATFEAFQRAGRRIVTELSNQVNNVGMTAQRQRGRYRRASRARRRATGLRWRHRSSRDSRRWSAGHCDCLCRGWHAGSRCRCACSTRRTTGRKQENQTTTNHWKNKACEAIHVHCSFFFILDLYDGFYNHNHIPVPLEKTLSKLFFEHDYSVLAKRAATGFRSVPVK